MDIIRSLLALDDVDQMLELYAALMTFFGDGVAKVISLQCLAFFGDTVAKVCRSTYLMHKLFSFVF